MDTEAVPSINKRTLVDRLVNFYFDQPSQYTTPQEVLAIQLPELERRLLIDGTDVDLPIEPDELEDVVHRIEADARVLIAQIVDSRAHNQMFHLLERWRRKALPPD